MNISVVKEIEFFGTNKNVLILISLQPDVVNL